MPWALLGLLPYLNLGPVAAWIGQVLALAGFGLEVLGSTKRLVMPNVTRRVFAHVRGDRDQAGLPVTIILSVATTLYAVQVSDRLLTLKVGNRYEPWDPASNKSIIMHARDGLVSMGYSGPAHIYGATMDGWIAGVLSGEEDLGADQPRPSFGLRVGGTRPSLPLHAHLTAVADRLNEAFKAAKVTHKHSITYVGQRWRSLKRPAWPVFGRICWGCPPGCLRDGDVKAALAAGQELCLRGFGPVAEQGPDDAATTPCPDQSCEQRGNHRRIDRHPPGASAE